MKRVLLLKGMRGKVIHASLGVILLCLGAATVAQETDPSQAGQWDGPFDWPIPPVHTHLLPNGKMLAWALGRRKVAKTDARVWDPATNTFTQAPNTWIDLHCAGHSFLPDGRLLVTGGNVKLGVGEKQANIFDFRDNTWTRVEDMNSGRWYPTNCTLANGEVLVIAGTFTTRKTNTLPEVWKTNEGGGWRPLTTAKIDLSIYPYMHVAPNGKVFNAGPYKATRYLDTSGTGSWEFVAENNFGFRGSGTSVMYDEGKVLIIGGMDPPTETAEVIDLNDPSPAWRYVDSMIRPRRHHNTTILPDGKVLATGGTSLSENNEAGAVLEAEIWDPETEEWSTMASMSVQRLYHSTSVLLPDARVLIGNGDGHPNVEFYSPPYMFQGSRPSITAAADSVGYEETFLVKTPDAARITAVNWVRLTSVTHSSNQSQRFNRLAFSQAAEGVDVTAPANGNLCPPGYYMLFLLADGVPSVAKIIRIVAASGGVPAAPSDLTATAVPESQINLTWVDNASNEDGFLIERSPDGTTFAEIATLGASLDSFSDTGLSVAATYYYRVRAYNADGNSDYSGVASATTNAPALSLSPESLSFGNQAVNTTSDPQGVILTSTGEAPLTIFSVALSGDFAETDDCGASVAAGTSCTLNFTFTPTATGPTTGTMTISSDAPDSPHTIALSGTGIDAGSAVTLSATSLTFADQIVGTTSDPQSVTLTNTDTAPLALTSIDVSGDFAQSNDCGTSVAAGASCTVNFTFTPTATGPTTGTMTITSDAPDSPHTIALLGTGIAAGSAVTLTATGYMRKRLKKVDLEWSAATSTNVDVYRNGGYIGTVENNGFYSDHIAKKGGGTYTYQVCEEGTSVCSNEATVTF